VAAGVFIEATVPTNAFATVRIPFPASTNLGSIVVSEGNSTVFANGTFVAGTPGVLAGKLGATDLPVGQATIDIEVSSGNFVFSSS
jgi:hypothetical protein